jgi:hypothetical protein
MVVGAKFDEGDGEETVVAAEACGGTEVSELLASC